MDKSTSLYEILGVSSKASSEEVTKMYEILKLKHHLEKEKFEEISKAYEILRHPERRESYDLCGEQTIKETAADKGKLAGSAMKFRWFNSEREAASTEAQSVSDDSGTKNIKFNQRDLAVTKREHKHGALAGAVMNEPSNTSLVPFEKCTVSSTASMIMNATSLTSTSNTGESLVASTLFSETGFPQQGISWSTTFDKPAASTPSTTLVSVELTTEDRTHDPQDYQDTPRSSVTSTPSTTLVSVELATEGRTHDPQDYQETPRSSAASTPSTTLVPAEFATDCREHDPHDRQETLNSLNDEFYSGCKPIIEYDPLLGCLPSVMHNPMFSTCISSTSCLYVNGYELLDTCDSQLGSKASKIIVEQENNVSSMCEAVLATVVIPSQEYSANDVLLIRNTLFHKVLINPNLFENNVVSECEAQPCENVSSYRTARLVI